MSYESKLYVMNEVDYNLPKNYVPFQGEITGYNQSIAVFNMGALPCDFREIFKEELKYPLYAGTETDGFEDIITEDMYGDKILKSDIKSVMEKIYEYMQNDNYRRLKPLYAFLSALKPEQWDKLIVIHYGY